MNKRNKRESRQELVSILAIALALLVLGGVIQAFGSSGGRAASQLLSISRVMTGNPSACYPVNGQYYDWVELENPGDSDVSLRGWQMADNIDLRGAFEFGGTVIPAGETLIVYCAPRPANAPEDAVFTGFRLSGDGELLLLADSMERVVQALDVPAMKPGWIYRRDESGDWRAEEMDTGVTAPDVESASALGELYINELMASNHSTLLDSDGDSSDWIELYNGGNERIDLEGYGLSTKGGKRVQWHFPAYTIEPGEYLMVFASGKNRSEDGELHTSFRLPAGGCTLRLYDRDDREIAYLSCNDIGRDVSASRTDDGGVTHGWPPTPGYHNSPTGLPDELPLLSVNDVDLYISEFANAPDGDWLELINASPTELDLSGIGLSDDLARPRKWQFPHGARIPAGGYLVVALSGDSSGRVSGTFTADFALSAGETLCLAMPDGRVIDQIRVPAMPAAASFGRARGEARYRCFVQPTPGAANAAVSYAKQTGQVSFSVPGGVHVQTALTVALESDAGAAIYYTTDGSQPTTTSALYAQPLTLTGSTTLRAVAYRTGELPSAASVSTYILGEQHPNLYVTCVSGDYEALIGPKGALNTGLKRDDCTAYVEIYDPSGTQLISQECNFMVSGQSSRQENPQKAFRLKAGAEYGDSRFRAKLFTRRDYDEFKAITLRASGQDCTRTHMLDSVLTSLADATSVMYLESEVAVVYVNGRYWGVYNLRERVTPQDIAQFEGWDDPENIVLVRNGQYEQGSTTSYNNLMKWVAETDLSVPENLAQLRQFVDVENYLDYVALEIYTSNLDLSNVRCYCNPSRGGKWRWILFDLDLSYQVDRNTPRDWLVPGGVGTITQQDNTLFVKLMENVEVRRYFLERCGELLRTAFSTESVVKRIQARYELLKPEMDANCARWNWSVGTWNKYGKKMLEFAQTRPAKLVNYFASAFQLSESDVQTYFAGVK